MTEILLEGRLVSGHPMEERPVIDENTKQPKLNALQQPRKSVSVGIAIPKTPGLDWKQEPWGQQLVAEGVASWPNGETNSPAFSWKVNDGDSTVPNKKGNRNCDKDGWPGHWVIFASGEIGPVRCFHTGKYQPHECIQNKAEIKRGDYCHLNVFVVKNTGQTPGLYVNPDFFVLDRPGVAIVGGETDVAATMAAAMGGTTATPTQTAPAETQAPPTGPVMTQKAIAAGKTYQDFITAGWNDAQLVQHGWIEAPVTPSEDFMAPPA